MIERDDLRADVGSGLLSEAQAANLISLADSRRGARENLSAGDEPFELFKGFNEIFIVVGLIILAFGWSVMVGVVVSNMMSDLQFYTMVASAAGAVILWLLAEYFVRKRRMVAPAIALSVMFAGNAGTGLFAGLSEPFMLAQNDFSSLPLPMILATAAVLVFWWRFRVPFAMAMIAVGLFATAIVYTASQSGPVDDITDLFLLSADGPFAWITLALGLAVFAVAMIFDMSDPHRVTRRAANGFWLHVVAAPALVNTVALTLLERDTSGAQMLLMGILLLFAVVAIIIDRRSFLIAGVGYIVTVAGALFDGEGAAASILILGVVLLLLGAFWERIRAVFLRALGPVLPLRRLPPSHL